MSLRNIFLMLLSSCYLLNIVCGNLLRLRNIALTFGVHNIFGIIFIPVVTFLYFEQQMGYGRRAMNLLIQYYEGKIPSLSEEGQEDKQISTLTGDEVFIDRM